LRVVAIGLVALMVITATIDRFEGEIAVLLVGEEESPVNVSRYDLPDGAWSAPWVASDRLSSSTTAPPSQSRPRVGRRPWPMAA
jgi:hypothetical protein